MTLSGCMEKRRERLEFDPSAAVEKEVISQEWINTQLDRSAAEGALCAQVDGKRSRVFWMIYSPGTGADDVTESAKTTMHERVTALIDKSNSAACNDLISLLEPCSAPLLNVVCATRDQSPLRPLRLLHRKTGLSGYRRRPLWVLSLLCQGWQCECNWQGGS